MRQGKRAARSPGRPRSGGGWSVVRGGGVKGYPGQAVQDRHQRPIERFPGVPLPAAILSRHSAASRLRGRPRPAARRRSNAAARSGSRETSASRLGDGGSRSSASARPRAVGGTGWAGRTKANSSSRSSAGRGGRPRRRKVAGAWISSGGPGPRAAASGFAVSSAVRWRISPSGVSSAARPWPAASAWGGPGGGGADGIGADLGRCGGRGGSLV